MKCESCNDRDATIHFTEIVGSVKREINLCEECARQKALPIQSVVSLSELLGTLLSHVQQSDLGELKDVKCSTCGSSFADFRSSGRLGCPQDYEVFRKPLVDILVRIQDGPRHIGKAPPSAGEALMKHNELVRLRRELEHAVIREEYEKARDLRDRIASLTRKPGENEPESQ